MLLALGTAVVHIRPTDYMSVPTKSNDMFIFALCLLCCSIITNGRFVEILINVDGEQSAIITAKGELIWNTFIAIFYVVAAIISGLEYYQNGNDDYGYDGYDDYDSYTNKTEGYGTAKSGVDRLLGGEEAEEAYGTSKGDVNHTPILLMLIGSFVAYFSYFCLRFLMKNEDHKK